MIYLVYTIHVVVSIFLILIVLLQQGKGADLSVFGGGATQTAFGARGATQIIHKLTVAFFGVFILTTLAIGLLQGHASGRTVMGDDDPAPAAVESPVGEAPAPAALESADPGAGETVTPAAPAVVEPTVVEPAPAEPAPAEPVSETPPNP